MPIRILLLAMCAGVVACLPTPDSPATDAAFVPPPSLEARDGTGRPASFDALPRRPRFIVSGIGDDSGARPVLVRGAADAALVDDASRAPWSAATLGRVIAVDVRAETTAVSMAPSEPMALGAEHVLLIPGWARDARGIPLGRPIVVPMRVAEAAAGATLVASSPADGSAAVPGHLAAFDVAFDDAVSSLGSLELVDAMDTVVPSSVSEIDCASIGFDAVACARLAPRTPLALGATHRLRIPDSVRDRYGDRPTAHAPSFDVGSTLDAAAPTPLPIACSIDETPIAGFCVLVQDVRLVVRARFAQSVRVIGTFAGASVARVDRFGDVELSFAGLTAATASELALRTIALDGSAISVSVRVETLSPLGAVEIAEIRADAIGDEPAQEYVELWNASPMPVNLSGFRLSDDASRAGDLIAGPLVLEADSRVLVVADGFDPVGGADARPPAGVRLVRVGASLGSGGLSNAGEPLFLRDALGHRVAEAPAIAAPGPGICIARLAPPARDSPPAAYGVAAHGACTPGTP